MLKKLNIERNELICLIILFVYISHFFILGKDTYVLIHDNLDSFFTYYSILARSHLFLTSSDTVVPVIGNGILRYGYPSGFSLITLLFCIFPSFNAYALNCIVLHFTAFFSMRAFLRYFSRSTDDCFLVAPVSLCFALLPFYPFAGGSIPLIPLGVLCFLRLKEEKFELKYLFLFVLIPFYSDFVLCWMFVLGFMFLVLAYDAFKVKEINKMLWMALLLQLFFFLLVEYRLVLIVLNETFSSHRAEFVFQSQSFKGALLKSFGFFLNGHYHASSLHRMILLPLLLISLVMSIYLPSKKIFKNLLGLGMVLVMFSIGAGFSNWHLLAELKNKYFLLRSVNLERFYFFFPFLWSVTLFYSLSAFAGKRFFKEIVFIVSLLQVAYCFKYSDFSRNYSKERISFSDFFEMNGIERLKKQLKTGDYVGVIGFHPSILQYNQIPTIDFYHYNYPLNVKHRFLKYIEEEIARNRELDRYFREWGNRAYLFSSEIGKKFLGLSGRCPVKHPIAPKFNFHLLAEDKVKFIVSICEIENKKYLDVYKGNYWTVYLYNVDSLVR